MKRSGIQDHRLIPHSTSFHASYWLIPSKAILPNYGASYSSTNYPYIDTNLQPGIQHCTLEDIDASGQFLVNLATKNFMGNVVVV